MKPQKQSARKELIDEFHDAAFGAICSAWDQTIEALKRDWMLSIYGEPSGPSLVVTDVNATKPVFDVLLHDAVSELLESDQWEDPPDEGKAYFIKIAEGFEQEAKRIRRKAEQTDFECPRS